MLNIIAVIIVIAADVDAAAAVAVDAAVADTLPHWLYV